jgi:hypothetical protein
MGMARIRLEEFQEAGETAFIIGRRSSLHLLGGGRGLTPQRSRQDHGQEVFWDKNPY